MATRQRQEAEAEYLSNPNYCLCCNKIIELKDGVKVSEIKKKKFCSSSCAAKINNTLAIKKPRLSSPVRFCSRCNNPFTLRKLKKGFYYAKLCPNCHWHEKDTIFDSDMTKGELFRRRKNYQSARSSIRNHAQKIFDASTSPKVCAICGYDTHIEVCHIIPVSDFSDDTLLSKINSLSNLVGLCPTHHWEFDAGLLDVSCLTK